VQVLSERSDGTRDEMRAVARFLGTHPARRLLVVTSKSHSTRSQKLFRAGLPREVEVAVHAVGGDPFDPDRWWKTGSGRRQVVHEYLGLLDYWRLTLWEALTGGDWLPAAGPVRIAAGGA
jgi:uncharacterized SAM-binding protein YcdF (DUF218 family)